MFVTFTLFVCIVSSNVRVDFAMVAQRFQKLAFRHLVTVVWFLLCVGAILFFLGNVSLCCGYTLALLRIF